MRPILRNALFAVLLVVGVVPGGPSAQAGQADKAWAGATARGACFEGGSVVVAAALAGEGVDVTMTVSGLPDGTHWIGGLMAGSDSNPDDFDTADLRRTVNAGGWTITKRLTAFDDVYVHGVAWQRGAGGPFEGPHCSVLVQPVKPLAAVTDCVGPLGLSLTAVQRGDGPTVVRWLAYGARPGSHWIASITASTDDSSTGAASEETANDGGVMRGKVSLDVIEPRLKLTLLADGGQRCTLRVERTLVPA